MHNLQSNLALSLAIAFSLFLITILHYGVKTTWAQNASITNTTWAQNASITNTTNNNINFLTFISKTLGLNSSYPSYWQASESNNTVSFTSPLKTVGVKIVIVPSKNMSLDEYTTNRILNFREKLINFNIMRSGGEELFSSPAQTLLFTYANGTNTPEILQAWTIKDNKAYIVTYFADAVLFDTFLPTAIKIINSFQIRRG
jgi:eukaryotic-like serine/threonine-protein kinase